MQRLGIAVLLVLGAIASETRALSIRATIDPPSVRAGEATQLNVEIDGVRNAPAPEIANVGGLQVRYIGPSSQVSIVNGRMTASVTHRYTVLGAQPGTFTIGPITFEHDGTRHDAGTVTLTVGATTGTQPSARAGSVPAHDQLALVLTVPKSEVYIHEQVPFELTLRVGNVRVGDLQYPQITGEGFSLEKFPEPAQRQEGGTQLVEFRSVLTPVKAGSVVVGPATISLSKLVRGRQGDAFFGFFGESHQPMQLRSEPVALTVLPLPDEGKPTEFSGAVGALTLDVAVAPRDVTAGDPVTITATIRGTGNLEHVTAPSLPPTPGLRLYAPQASAQQAPGARVFEQVVIPEAPGAITLPPLRFAFFDPAARAYRTLTGGDVPITVRPGAHADTAPRIVGAQTPDPTKTAETLGRDIVFIKDDPGTLAPIGARRHAQPLFWMVQLVAALVWAGVVLWDRRRHRWDTDARFARFSLAGKTARAAFVQARTQLEGGDARGAHDALARAVHEYLAAKLDLPPGGVTSDAIAARLDAPANPDGLAADMAAFLAAGEAARYAPGAVTAARVGEDLARAERIVKSLEGDRRLARSVTAAIVMVLLASVGARAAGDTDGPRTAFFQGNAAYTEERYAEAAAAYERVLAGGVESGAVQFNLGNAYLRSGDVGRAILAYERARRLMPRDPDLNANLTFARELAGDADEPTPWQLVVGALARVASTDTLWLAASIVWFALAGLRSVARLVPALARLRGPATVVLGIALAVTTGSALYRMIAIEWPTTAVLVTQGETSVRFEPSTTATPHFAAKPGAIFRVVAEREGWVQVARRDGLRGWVEATAIGRL